MDIKNLLCPIPVNDSVLLEDKQLTKPPALTIDVNQPWSTSSCSSSASSPLSSFSSPVSPTSSPPASPVSLPPLLQSDISPPHPNLRRVARHTPQTRTPWTPREDYLLQQGYAQGLSWAMISATYLPHRSRGCCWGRFKTLQSKTMEQRDWNAAEDRILMMAIKRRSEIFKQAWKSVAQEIGDRSWKECEMRSIQVANMIRKKQNRRGF